MTCTLCLKNPDLFKMRPAPTSILNIEGKGGYLRNLDTNHWSTIAEGCTTSCADVRRVLGSRVRLPRSVRMFLMSSRDYSSCDALIFQPRVYLSDIEVRCLERITVTV